MNRTLIPASHYGSLGDLAAVRGMLTVLGDHTKIVRRDHNDRFSTGQLFLGKYVNPEGTLHMIGADVLDGRYNPDRVKRMMDYCNKAAEDGNSVTVCGFSWSRPRGGMEKLIAGSHSSIRYVSRDAYSQQHFFESTGIAAELGADPAFLLMPDPALPQEIVKFIEEGSVPTILFNVNKLVKEAARPPTLLRDILDATGFRAILVPHDVRGNTDDRKQLEIQIGKLESRHDGRWLRSWKGNSWLSPNQVKYLASQCDGVFTQRMHLAIAALGSGVPVVAQGYAGKVLGCFKHFELERCVINDVLSNQTIVDVIVDKLCESIDTGIPSAVVGQVMNLARNNL